MSVSFGRRYVDQFNLPSNQPKSPQSDSVHFVKIRIDNHSNIESNR